MTAIPAPKILRCMDFETTGFKAPEDQPVEVGFTDVRVSNLADVAPVTVIAAPWSVLLNPGRPIPPETSAIHHIVDDDVLEARSLAEVVPDLVEGAPAAFVFHKADFDMQWFAPKVPVICTWKCAIRLAPKAPGHSNQVLRYWLKLELNREATHPTHRAGPDTYVTAHLLARMLTKHSVDELVQITKEKVVLPYLVFGKHAMQPIEEIPSGYLEWMLKQADMDKDAKHTAFHHLGLRRAGKSRVPDEAAYP